MKKPVLAAATLLGLMLATGSAFAQATRTWVSGVGDDANPCSRTSPCKTFAGAFIKTAAGGEISVLDPGGYGPLTANKAITINGNGMGSILAYGGANGITVNAGTGDVVTIRNVSFNGASVGVNGIRVLQAGAVIVENCDIFQFTQSGIDMEPNNASQLFVKNTVLRKNGVGGALVKPGASGWVDATFDTVQFERNSYGLRTEARTNTVVRNSSSTGNVNNGYVAVTADVTKAELTLESSVSANNTNGGTAAGVQSNGAGASVRLSNVTVVDNDKGVLSANAGALVSFGNNRVYGNLTNGAPTITLPQN